MKKQLLTLPVLMMCNAAWAQSTVTVFGVVDVNYAQGSGSASNASRLASGSNASSRIGFRGTEDLGAGLKASFWLEGQLNADDGSGVATNSNNQAVPAFVPATGANAPVRAGTQALTFGRRSTVSLAAGWGELRLGRDFTAHYRNRVDTDPFGVVGVGATQANVGSLAGLTSTRASNMIGYFLPGNLGGFFGQVQYFLGENNSGAATSDNGSGYSLRGGYGAGSITASIALGRLKASTGDVVSTNVGAIYDAKVVRVMAAWFSDKTESAVAVTGQGYTLGAIAPIGSGDLKLAFSRYGSDAGPSPQTDKIALGYVHNLSKRTAIYATFASVNNSGGASTALNGAVTAANGSSTGYDLGVRHSF